MLQHMREKQEERSRAARESMKSDVGRASVASSWLPGIICCYGNDADAASGGYVRRNPGQTGKGAWRAYDAADIKIVWIAGNAKRY